MKAESRHNGLEKDNGCLTCPTCCNNETRLDVAESQSCATVECQATNKRTTLQDKSCLCENDTQTQTSSKTSGAVSTSNGKDLTPFYNDFCKEISSHLLSHTEIDSAVSGLNSFNPCLKRMAEKSWFSTSLNFLHNENSRKICWQFFTSSLAECTVSDGTRTKSRKIRIYPSKEQKHLFNQWFGVSRLVYNNAVAYYKRDDKEQINWMAVAKQLLQELSDKDYVKAVPYQVKKIAVKDCYYSYIVNCRKTKRQGTPFRLKFRKRKDPKQSCFIPKQALSDKGIYHTISGKMKFSERPFLGHEFKDLRLVREYDRWYVVVPMVFNETLLPCSENQRNGDVVAIDPGVRSFTTMFSENGFVGKIGYGHFNLILSLNFQIDKLVELRDNETDKQRRRRLKRKLGKLRLRLSDLVDELHWKTANFLVRNFNVIILPTFETSEMTRREGRKIKKTVARTMLSLRFYEFGERLAHKCEEYGCLLIRSNEAYTSKTNSFNGEVFEAGSRKSFKYDGVRVDRDINAARNILLRAMRDSSSTAAMPLAEL